jgi:hypothetical protein
MRLPPSRSHLFCSSDATPSPQFLFEEGDAVLGRRTQVSAADDRYANLGISYLLD